MKSELILRYRQSFEECAKEYQGVECWSARDLQALLGYEKWSNFHEVVLKAMESCKNSKQKTENHFADVGKMVDIGSGTTRELEDYFLTRFACYLIAQNGDPRKEVIAFAQTYFALQTRKQELLEERILLHERLQARAKLTETEKRLSENLYQRGVDESGFARKVLLERGIKPEELPPEEDTKKMQRREATHRKQLPEKLRGFGNR